MIGMFRTGRQKSLQERVSPRGRLARIAPAVVILAVLWGCGSGGGERPAVPETGPANGRSSLPPGIPTSAYLWMDTFRPGAPVMEFGGSVHVGADVAPAADALAGNDERNGVALSKGTVRDGTSAADVVRYLRTAASHNVSAGSVTGLATYPEAQTMSVVLVSGKETRNWDTRFGRLTQDAVGIVNAALPFERQIRISPHLTPEGSGGAFLGRAVGEIWVQFIPKTHPVYPGGADPLELGRTAVFYYVRDEGAATLEISEDGAGYSTVIIDSERAASLSDPEVVHVLIHELLHAVGFVSHTDPREFDSTLSDVGFFPGTQPRALIHPIDRDGVLAAYSRFAPGALPEDITAESLGPWADASSHVRGDLGIGAGEIAFGVAFRNGLAQPWAFGPKPGSALGHNPALSGSVNWSGALLGITPSGRGVVSDSSLTLDMESLSGELAFTGMRYEGGGPWGDGDLRYAVRASGSDNTFARSDAEFIRVGPGYAWSGKDLGAVTGVFFGSGHEGMGGVLERHDLSGFRRETVATAIGTGHRNGNRPIDRDAIRYWRRAKAPPGEV